MWENAVTFYLDRLAEPLVYTVGSVFFAIFLWRSFKAVIHNRMLRDAFTICEVLGKYHNACPEKAKQHKEELERIGRLAKSFHAFEEKVNTPIVLDILLSQPTPRSMSDLKRFEGFLEEPGMKKVFEKTVQLYATSMVLASPWIFIIALVFGLPVLLTAALYKKTSKITTMISHAVTLFCDKDADNKLAAA